MKAYILIPFAVLLGLVLGGWGPRSELRTVKEELRKTKRLLEKGAARQDIGTDVANVTRMLGISRSEQATAKGESETSTKEKSQDMARDSGAESNVTKIARNETAEAKPLTEAEKQKEERKKRMEEDINKAIEIWKLRSDIARSTFLANGDFSEEDTINFDVLMKAMNIRLGHTIEEWAKDVEGKEHVGAEEGIRLMNGVTDVFVLTYDAMDKKLPEDWRETGGKGMRLFDFIDPSVAKPMIGVEERLNEISKSLEATQNDEDIE